MRKITVFTVLTIAIVTLAASPAVAEKASNSNGVGVCFSQLAIDPSQEGVTHFGELVRTAAGPELTGHLDGARNACGEPPGPGNLR